MEGVKVYHYAKCSTCRDALKFLDAKGVQYEAVEIDKKPPSKSELKRMLGYYGGNLRRLFNTSGLVYKELGLKDKLPGLTEMEALDLLAKHGKLVKRPFVLGEDFGMVGFAKTDWDARFSS
jgi:Spx/MgsR family transcriptional regulator